MSAINLLPPRPPVDQAWLYNCARHMQLRRSKLAAELANDLALHAFNATFLLPPEEAAHLWDDILKNQCPGWDELG